MPYLRRTFKTNHAFKKNHPASKELSRRKRPKTASKLYFSTESEQRFRGAARFSINTSMHDLQHENKYRGTVSFSWALLFRFWVQIATQISNASCRVCLIGSFRDRDKYPGPGIYFEALCLFESESELATACKPRQSEPKSGSDHDTQKHAHGRA